MSRDDLLRLLRLHGPSSLAAVFFSCDATLFTCFDFDWAIEVLCCYIRRERRFILQLQATYDANREARSLEETSTLQDLITYHHSMNNFYVSVCNLLREQRSELVDEIIATQMLEEMAIPRRSLRLEGFPPENEGLQ